MAQVDDANSQDFEARFAHRKLKTDVVKQSLKAGLFPHLEELKRRDQSEQREGSMKKRDLSGRANGTIDPWYGCDLYDEMIDYALNFSLPWSGCYSRSLRFAICSSRP